MAYPSKVVIVDPSKLEVVADNSPRRCQEVTGIGQCKFKTIDGADRCPVHFRHSGHVDKKKKHQYLLAYWQNRVDEFADSDDIKSLAGEIGVLKMTLENVLNSLHSPALLLTHANTIGDLVSRIERVTVTLNNLEMKTGKMLDKSTLLRLAGDIVDIMIHNIPDPVLAEKIGNEIIEKVLTTQCLTENE